METSVIWAVGEAAVFVAVVSALTLWVMAMFDREYREGWEDGYHEGLTMGRGYARQERMEELFHD